MANTVKTETGIEVYKTKIEELADTYIFDLSDNADEQSMMIKKTPVFKGMLKYIYNSLFKIGKGDIRYNNKNSNLDYEDIDTLNDLWDIYTSLCYKYMQNPTLLNFSLFTGIAHETLTDWTTGNYRGGADKSSSPHCQSAKKWRKECESAAYDVAMSGNPGGMFILKANYGYVESAQRIEISTKDQNKSVEQIIAERVPELSQNDGQLELPDGDF